MGAFVKVVFDSAYVACDLLGNLSGSGHLSIILRHEALKPWATTDVRAAREAGVR
jgi:hypothetical protein